MPIPIRLIDGTPPETIQYGRDVARLQHALHEYGYHATERQSRKLWELHSDYTCRGWSDMNTLTDAQLVHAVERFFTATRG